ncbi:MAG: hypothetical protein QM758_05400 [Armatimonas sp.]
MKRKEQLIMENDIDKTREIVREVATHMVAYTGQSLIGIYGYVGNNLYRLVGTSTLFAFNDRTYLLSAAHVLRHDANYEYLAHYAGPGVPPQKLHRVAEAYDDEHDVALVEVFPEAIGPTGKVALSIEHLAADASDLAGDLLFFLGLPGALSKTVGFNELHSDAMGYPTQLAVNQEGAGSGFFTIDYAAGDTGIDLQGNPTLAPPPNGASGSALWRTNRRGKRPDWRPEEAKIVGVLTRWVKEEKLIDVASVEAVHKLFATLDTTYKSSSTPLVASAENTTSSHNT